jgi:hypothetical protein
MNCRRAPAIFLVAVFAAFPAIAVGGQERQSADSWQASASASCLHELPFEPAASRRLPRRLLLASYLDLSAGCEPSPPDSPSERTTPPGSSPLVPARIEEAGADLIENELRELEAQGFTIAVVRRQVLAILRESTACSAWYAQAEANPAGKFATLHFRLDSHGEDAILGDYTLAGLFYREPYVARAQENVGAGSTITLNAKGAFFVARAPVQMPLGVAGSIRARTYRAIHVGNYPGGSLNAQVATLLHEFAHVVGLLPVDMGENRSALLSTQNTETVLEHCRRQIDASAQRAVVLPASLGGLNRRSKIP